MTAPSLRAGRGWLTSLRCCAVVLAGGSRAAAALSAFGWVTLALVVLDAPVPLRSVSVFCFACAGPGTAMTGFLRRVGWLERAVLSVALSTSLATLLAETMALTGTWSPIDALVALSAVCSVAVALRALRDRRAHSFATPSELSLARSRRRTRRSP